MADKRYYWLKLKEDYFNSPKIKKLRKIAGGDTYTIIYLKMQLLSIKNKGIIEYEKIEPTFEDELALKLDEDVENVKITLAYIEAQGLIDKNENDEFLLFEASNNVGSECESAERVRQFRERENQKLLQGNGSVTEVKRISISNSISNSNSVSISNNKEKENIIVKEKETKHKYGEYKNVLLKDSELQKLKEKYGEEKAMAIIDYCSERFELKKYNYNSHYLAILKWVAKAYEDDLKEKSAKTNEKGKSMWETLDEAFDE